MTTQYEVRIDGHLDARWFEWFEGMTCSIRNDGTTVIAGPLADQAALQGLLRKVGDLGMTLISVDTVEQGTAS